MWTVLSILLLSLVTSAANAAIIYDWEGVCEIGCADVSISTGVLTLDDTFNGDDTSVDSAFISWVYSWDGGASSYTITNDSTPSFNGTWLNGFVGTMDNPEEITVDYTVADDYHYEVQGVWEETNKSENVRHNGTEFGWTRRAVPEPSAIALMGLGLLGFGISRRKQKKS